MPQGRSANDCMEMVLITDAVNEDTQTHFEELQSANRGRKGAHVDRRPMDPPPVVSLTLYEIQYYPMSRVAYPLTTKNIQLVGLICVAELFSHCRYTMEWKNVTEHLVGDKVVTPVHMMWNGQSQIMFAFGNLVVLQEGKFRLRFRLFEVVHMTQSSFEGGQASEAIEECWGSEFEIFSSKLFPSLDESTELSKALANMGVKVNVRGRKRKQESTSSPGPSSHSTYNPLYH